MEIVLAHIHVTKCYKSYKCILISYHHKHLHLWIVSNHWLLWCSIIFLFRRQHVLRQFKLIFHRFIVQVYLKDTRRNTRRLGQWTSLQRHGLPRVHHPIEQSIPSKKAINISYVLYLAFTKLNKKLYLTIHVLFHPHWHRQLGCQWAHSANRSLDHVVWSFRPYTFPTKRRKL
jgi:hypothetical protein